MQFEWKDLVFVLLIVLSAFLTFGIFSMNIRLGWWEKNCTTNVSDDDAKANSSQDMYNWLGVNTLVIIVSYFGWLLWTQVFGSQTKANIKGVMSRMPNLRR